MKKYAITLEYEKPSKYYISIYEPARNRTSFFESLEKNDNDETVAHFSYLWMCHEAAFSSLADAQCFCKVLLSSYVKKLKFLRHIDIDDADRQNIEVQLYQYQYLDDKNKMADPIPVGGGKPDPLE